MAHRPHSRATTARVLCAILAAALTATLALQAAMAGRDKPDDTYPTTAPATGSVAEPNGDPAIAPPPRRIGDITAILDEYELTDPEHARRDEVAADAAVPAGLDGAERIDFLRLRGLAAGRIGRVGQQLSDLAEAVRLALEGHYPDKSRLLYDLSHAEARSGNWADAIVHRSQAIGSIPKKHRGRIIVWNNSLARLYAASGDIARADQIFAKVEQLLEEARQWRGWGRKGAHWRATFYYARGKVLDLRGQYEEAEEAYRAALDALAEFDQASSDEKIVDPEFRIDNLRALLGRNLLYQNRLVAAEIEVRGGLLRTLARGGRYTADTAVLVGRLARVVLEQGRTREAELLARAHVEIYESMGARRDSYSLARARDLLATTLIARGKWKKALAVYETIAADMSGDRAFFDRTFGTNLDWALAELRAGEVESARDRATRAAENLTGRVGAKHYDAAEARGVLAIAIAAAGDHRKAATLFAESLPILLSRSRRSSDENVTRATRAVRRTEILEGYIGLLAEVSGTALEAELGIDAAAEAFRMADTARGQSVQRALTANAARAAASDPDLAALARREQDALTRIGALNGLLVDLMAAPADQRDADAILDLRTRIDRLRSTRATLVEEIEARFPDYAQLVNPKPASLEEAQASLRLGEALIATYLGPDRSYLWAIPAEGAPVFATTDDGRRAIADHVALLRASLEPNASTIAEVPPFDLVEGHELYSRLLAPVASGWKDARNLLVVADGPLGFLPFSVLVTEPYPEVREMEPYFAGYREVPWLARTHAITVLPSVASLYALRRLPPGTAERKAFVGFGDPYFSLEQASQAAEIAEGGDSLAVRGAGSTTLVLRDLRRPEDDDVSVDLGRLPRLFDTREELRGVALALGADPATDLFLGAAASETAVKSMSLADYRVLAFATHGLVPGDLDGLTEPALALSAPEVAGGGGDGLLTLSEVLALELDADWVVLSACNTGLGDGAGAEAVSGLGRAFFYAGTRALLVSNWPVHSRAAKELTTELFRRQAAEPGIGRAEALRQAMMAMVDGPGYVEPGTGRTLFSYAHPLFWAPFSLVGDGGAAEAAP